MSDSAKALAVSRKFLTVGDVDDIVALVVDLPPQPVVADLGAGSGTSAIAVLETRPDAIVWGVDVEQENLDWAEINVRAFLGDEAASRYRPWRGTVQAAAIRLDYSDRLELGHVVAAILHDASHDEFVVEADLRMFAARVAPGTPLWVHDFAPMDGAEDTYPGVARAIERLTSEGVISPADRAPAGIGWLGRFGR